MLSGPHDHGTFLPVLAPDPQTPAGRASRAWLAGDRRRRLGEDLAVVTLSLAGDLARAVRRARRLPAGLTGALPHIGRGEGLHARTGRVRRAALVPGNRVRAADTERRSVCLLGGPSPLVGPPNATRPSVN